MTNNWDSIEELTGYKPFTTYYQDFSVTEKSGKDAILELSSSAYSKKQKLTIKD